MWPSAPTFPRRLRPRTDSAGSGTGQLPLAGAVGSLMLDQETARVRGWLAGAAAEEPEWLLASTMTASSFYATREELDELARQIEALTEHFSGR